MKYCVNLGVIYHNDGIDAILNGMRIVKEAGFDTVEFFSFRNEEEVDKVVKLKNELGLKVSLFIPIRGSLVDPSARGAYVDGIKEGVKYAKKLDCKLVTLVSGLALKDVSREEQHKNMVDTLKAIAPLLEEADITGVLEPLDQLCNPGNFLTYSKEGFETLDEVGSKNTKLLYDIFHQQICEGNLIPTIVNNIDKIGHIHGAGYPGRHELDTGEINYKEIIKAIKETNYDGYFGLEYKPSKDFLTSLKEAREFLGIK